MVDGVTLDALKKKYKKLKKKAEVGKGDAKTSRKDTDASDSSLKLKKKKKVKDKDGVSKKRKSTSSGEGESPTKKKKIDSKSKLSGDGTNKKKTVGHLVIVPDAEKRKKQNSSPKKLKDITKVAKGGKKSRGRPKKIAVKGSGDAPTSSPNGADVKPRVEDGVSDGEEEDDRVGEYSETSRWVMFDHRYSAVLKPQGKPSSSKNTYKHKHQPRPSREEEGRRQMVRMRKGKGKDVSLSFYQFCCVF